jgi:hypothetical protein
MAKPWVILSRDLAADAVGGEPLNRSNRVKKQQRCVSDGLKGIAMRFSCRWREDRGKKPQFVVDYFVMIGARPLNFRS